MDATSRIAAKYRYLFRPPGSRLAPVLILLTAALVGAVLGQGSLPPQQALLWVLSLGIGPIALNLLASVTAFRGSDVATVRRLNMMTLLENYFILAGSVIGALAALVLGTPRIAYGALLASLSLAAYVRTTVLATFDSRRWKGVVAGVTGSLVRAPLGLVREELALPVIASILWGLSLSALSVILLSLGPEGLSPIRLAAGFVGVILGGRAESLERELRPLMERKEFTTTALLFDCASGRRVALLVTGFHFGPFRNVGSSMMNYLIELELSRRGVDGLVVKGCSGHGADLFDGSEVRRVAVEVAEALSEVPAGVRSATLSLLPQREVEGVKVMGLEADGLTLVVPTLNPEPMEDIPPELERLFPQGRIRVIDPHNSYHDGYDGLGEGELRRIARAIGELLGSERVKGFVRVALVRKIPEAYGPHDGIGPSGLALLGIEVGGKKMALAVVDGNNALPHVRDEVLGVLKGDGWDFAELLTTDTHAVNGVRLGGRGYRPVGEGVSAKEVAEVFRQLSAAALAGLERAEVSVVEVKHREVPVLVERAMEKFAALMRRSIAIYLLLMALSALIPLLL
ncbi:MAG: DUF2070 family protein [Nitrososphaerota archaeon]